MLTENFYILLSDSFIAFEAARSTRHVALIVGILGGRVGRLGRKVTIVSVLNG